MTIAEYCRERNVSRATLYRKMRETGVNMNAIRDPSGQLTIEGLQIISGITDASHVSLSHKARETGDETPRDTEVIQLNHEIELLRIQLAAANDTISRLTSELSDLRSERDRITIHSQTVEKALFQELTRTWVDRLFNRNRVSMNLLTDHTEP